jgi:hypothetical protein
MEVLMRGQLGRRGCRGGLCIAAVSAVAVLAAPAFGATWVTQPTPGLSGLLNSSFTSVSCPSATFCMAVGSADNRPNSDQISQAPVVSLAERWDGTAWGVLPTPATVADAGLYAVSCASESFCVAVGENHSFAAFWPGTRHPYGRTRALVEIWNGTTWTVQSTPAASMSQTGLYGVSCSSSTFCVAVGAHGSARSKGSALAEVWSGSTWRLQRTPKVAYAPSLSAVSCTAPTNCMAVGSYDAAKKGESQPRPLAERWDGRRWSSQRPPADHQGNTEMTALSCTSPAFCMATGLAQRAQNGISSAAFAARFDGKRWSAAAAGLPHNSPFYGVSCVSNTSCLAAGQFDTSIFPAPETVHQLVEGWNGKRWGRVALPDVPGLTGTPRGFFDGSDPALRSISCLPGGGCTAVGAQGRGSDDATLAQTTMGR